jgi:hypothetical protein
MTTTPVTITIGLTITDRPGDYIPALDGWRPGAAQQIVKLGEVKLPSAWTRTNVAEALFALTNAPAELWLGRDGYDALSHVIAYDLRGLDRALSVGDTVTVDGVTLACERVGWINIEH